MFNLNSFGNTHQTPDLKWVASSAEVGNGSILGPSTPLPRCQQKIQIPIAINKSHLINQDTTKESIKASLKALTLHEPRGAGSNSPNQSSPYLCSQEQDSALEPASVRQRGGDGKQTNERTKEVMFFISTHVAEVIILFCNKKSSPGTIQVCQSYAGRSGNFDLLPPHDDLFKYCEIRK